MRILVVSTTLILTFSLAYSQDLDSLSSRVDSLFEEWNPPGSPGCAVAIIKGHDIVYQRCFGLASLNYNIPITPSTIFHAASISKQFTAFLIATLAKEHALSLDDDINKYLPEIPDFGSPITLRHLIDHASGLYEQSTFLKLSGVEVVDWVSNEHVMKVVKRLKRLNFIPGDEILYCNTGYTLLAEIIERVSGKSLQEFANERIFLPLGMSHSQYYDDLQRIVSNMADSYIDNDNGSYSKGILNFSTVGATGLITTIEDMTKWLENFADPRIGSDIIEQMFTSGTLNSGTKSTYGLGIGITEYNGLKYVLHSGHDAAYRSYLGYFPHQKFGMVILGNVESLDGMELGKRIADIYLNHEFHIKEAAPIETETTGISDEEQASFKLGSKQLREFTGPFYSEELETIYSIIVRDGQLIATHIRNEDVVLSPVKKDQFIGDAWWFRNVKFVRDENGAIKFFKLTAGRIRNIEFVKM